MYINLDVVMSIDFRPIFHEMRISIPWETDQGYKVLPQGGYFIKTKNTIVLLYLVSTTYFCSVGANS